jgi:2,4-dienoyl-CoA reductase-like NADH-dependent reductase (Old Yellow Enzyme family)
MSILFEPMKLGNVEIKNRFVRSATYEGMAAETGEVTDGIIKICQQLAKGDVGLIIPGLLYVHPLGRAFRHQAGIHNDDMIPGLKKVVETVHQQGGKIAFQLAHAGRQTTKGVIGQTPIGPSAKGRDPVNFVKPKAMTEGQIHQIIQAFGKAAERAVIREPFVVKSIKEGRTDVVSCVSCNRCLAAVANDMPVRCYNKGFTA